MIYIQVSMDQDMTKAMHAISLVDLTLADFSSENARESATANSEGHA